MSHELIKNLPADKWNNVCFHTERGIYTFAEWLDDYSTRVTVHVNQMARVYEDYLKKNIED